MQGNNAAVGAGLPAPWSVMGDEVVNQIGDLLGVRLGVRRTGSVHGTWSELQAQFSEHTVGMAAQLADADGGACRVGLLWAVEDHGTPIDWIDQDEIRQAVGQAVIAGMVNGLHAATGQKVTLTPATAPAEITAGRVSALDADAPGEMLIWEAAGDDVTFTFALIAPEGVVEQEAAPAEAPQARAGLSQGEQRQEADPPQAKPEQPKVATRPPHLPSLQKSKEGRQQDLALIMDLPLNLTVEIGSARLRIKDVLALGKGAVVELDRLAGDWVDIRVNDKLLARGEVVVLPDGRFGVRVMEIINAKDRLQNLAGAK